MTYLGIPVDNFSFGTAQRVAKKSKHRMATDKKQRLVSNLGAKTEDRYVSFPSDTLPKTNIAPTNGWLEYYFPIGEAYFQGLR